MKLLKQLVLFLSCGISFSVSASDNCNNGYLFLVNYSSNSISIPSVQLQPEGGWTGGISSGSINSNETIEWEVVPGQSSYSGTINLETSGHGSPYITFKYRSMVDGCDLTCGIAGGSDFYIVANRVDHTFNFYLCDKNSQSSFCASGSKTGASSGCSQI